jgi:hypothetical protein
LGAVFTALSVSPAFVFAVVFGLAGAFVFFTISMLIKRISLPGFAQIVRGILL